MRFDKEGRYTEHADEFAGVHIDDGFDNIVSLIQERGNLERIEDYANKNPNQWAYWCHHPTDHHQTTIL